MDNTMLKEVAICHMNGHWPRDPPRPPTILPSPLSKEEATYYYNGIPSQPVLVARTSNTPWPGSSIRNLDVLTTNSATIIRKELQPIGDHPLKDVWEDNVAFRVHKILDDMKVDWTSTDVVRIGDTDEQAEAPVVLWIGIKPTSLSGYDALDVANKCHDVLIDYGIRDVDVEIRESAVTRWTALPSTFKFLPVGDPLDPTSHLRSRLTAALGIPISALEFPYHEGTGGFFMTAGGQRDRLLLVTARHVLFPVDKHFRNTRYERTKKFQPKHQISVMSPEDYIRRHMRVVNDELGRQALKLQSLEQCVQNLPLDAPERSEMETELAQAQAGTDRMCETYRQLVDVWPYPTDRVLGHAMLSPPLQYGPPDNDPGHEGYTSDWAVIEMAPETIDSDNFYGNVIDLSSIPDIQLTEKLGPGFTYPPDRLFKLHGSLSGADIRRGSSEPQSENLLVLKNGGGTGLTLGRANDVCSYARSTYFQEAKGPYYMDANSLESYTYQRTKEWAILPFDSSSGSFAFEGDSGAVVATTDGRIGGIITGGTGLTQVTSNEWARQDPQPFTSDITYVTPIHFLLRQMDQAGLKDICLNPVLKSPTTD